MGVTSHPRPAPPHIQLSNETNPHGTPAPTRASAWRWIARRGPATTFLEGAPLIHHPPGVGRFQFVVLATLRATQLLRGCRPRIDGAHKATVLAQLEVSEGKVMQLFTAPETTEEPAPIDSAAIEPVSAPVSAI